MGVDKRIIKAGNGADFPKKNDLVTIEYTGYLHDPSASEFKGEK
jgi:FK506-binding protein 1